MLSFPGFPFTGVTHEQCPQVDGVETVSLPEFDDEFGQAALCVYDAIIVPDLARLTRVEGARDLPDRPLAAERILCFTVFRQGVHKGGDVVVGPELTPDQCHQALPGPQ